MRAEERHALRAKYDFRCGYCGVRETDVGSELTVDHFWPRSHGGREAFENLVYACHACNEFKADYWQPDGVFRVLHPLTGEIERHIAERPDGIFYGLTTTGEFHISRLQLNRAALVAHRRELRLLENARRERAQLVQRLSQTERRIEDLLAQLEALSEPPSDR